jgi:hypothetical protein
VRARKLAQQALATQTDADKHALTQTWLDKHR